MAQTTARVLQLLGLLQSRPVWSGAELAERLGVTERSVRRDVERLQELGYPVGASKGVGGGYRLGAGRALPPLLLDADEAVAVAVCLRLAAGGTVAGVGEAALRTLTKLDQVLPARSARRSPRCTTTVTIESRTEAVDPACCSRSPGRAATGCGCASGYVDRAGEATQRVVEPYRMVATGRRWYLLAYDVAREDWRTFRLDRMRSVEATTWVFAAREADAREFHRAPSASRPTATWPGCGSTPLPRSSPSTSRRRRGRWSSSTTPPACSPRGPDHLDHLSVYLAAVGADFAVLEPPELREVMADWQDASAGQPHVPPDTGVAIDRVRGLPAGNHPVCPLTRQPPTRCLVTGGGPPISLPGRPDMADLITGQGPELSAVPGGVIVPRTPATTPRERSTTAASTAAPPWCCDPTAPPT